MEVVGDFLTKEYTFLMIINMIYIIVMGIWA